MRAIAGSKRTAQVRGPTAPVPQVHDLTGQIHDFLATGRS
jgi:hypothetical protein